MNSLRLKKTMGLRRVVAAILFSMVLVFSGNVSVFDKGALAQDWVASAQAQIPPEQMTTKAMPADGLTFHFLKRYSPAIEKLAEEAPALRERAHQNLGLVDPAPIDVWILPKVSDYYALRGEPNRAPEWAVGLSLSGRSTIIVAHGGQRTPDDVMFTYAHELAHVAVDQARGDVPVPRWFHEGFAVMMAQEWTPERSEKLSQAAARGQLQPFSKLTRTFPSHQMSVSLAYDQSFHFVRWMQDKYGADFWARVMRQMEGGADFDGAIRAEAGITLPEIESQWHEQLSSSTNRWSILADETIIFFGVSLLFILAYIRARSRRRRQLASMEDDNSDEWRYDPARYPLPGD